MTSTASHGVDLYVTVHMLRVITSVEGDYSLAELNTAMDDWVANHSEWVDDTQGHPMVDHIPDDGSGSGPLYRTGRYRFLFTDAKDNLVQKCEDKLANKVSFYRIKYHLCDHDENSPEGCEWGEVREWTDKDVTIPPGVP